MTQRPAEPGALQRRNPPHQAVYGRFLPEGRIWTAMVAVLERSDWSSALLPHEAWITLYAGGPARRLGRPISRPYAC